jgi:hypothetical protein
MSSSSEPTDPIIVARPATEFEAAILRGVLDAEGIRSWILGGLTSGFRAEAPGKTKLAVRAADAEKAREILARSDDAGEGRVNDDEG